MKTSPKQHFIGQKIISTALFEPKPVVVFLSLAFGSVMSAQLAQAATSNLNLQGNYSKQVLIDNKGKAGSQPGTSGFNAAKVNAQSGQEVLIKTTAVTDIDSTQKVNETALMVNTSGGNGGSHENNGSRLVGGKGGHGGKIELDLVGGDLKIAAQAIGLLFDSHGGNAGNNTKGNDASKSDHATAGVGGNVLVNTGGKQLHINTYGKQHDAMAVNARGGHGARGRYDNSIAFWTKANNGSSGGKGGEVTLQLNGHTVLSTTGEDSSAIRINTDAGNGGDVGLGGSNAKAGNGGNGGKQTLVIGHHDTKSDVSTQGIGSSAISMKSSAGNGGSVNSGTNIFHTKTPGNGGNGGGLSLDLHNTQVSTQSKNSHGVLLTSEGGFGGSGVTGSSRAGNGGAGGVIKVNVDQTSSIQTEAEQSDGIHAQSLGGSGSRGPNNIFLGGKSGGKGGSGKNVGIVNHGVITTKGKQSSAIYAISAGGAAGEGGQSTSIVAIGGRGGESGEGGNVTINNTGRLITAGDDAHVILAQSIGGNHGRLNAQNNYDIGGGKDLDAEQASAGKVEIINTGLINAQGNAAGVMAQSIGGGGGNGGGSFGFISIGGSAGASGNGGLVKVDNKNMILTQGTSNSSALVLQSIGGGGGYGGKASTVGGMGMSTLGIGGKGGNGGKGGDVVLNQSGLVATKGFSSPSIIAQSIGGGGGMGGASFAVGAYQPLAVSLGGKGGKGGDGGNVNINLNQNSTVMTTGDASAALIAQSIGGGGGVGGDVFSLAGASLAPVTIGGTGGSGGKGGAVTVNNQGNIFTKGNDSFGVIAQSVAGGGGHGGFASNMAVTGFPVSPDGKGFSLQTAIGGGGGKGNVGGKVSLTNSGHVFTQGQSSVAVLMQSIGGGGGNGGSTSTKMLQIPKQKNVEMHVAIGGKGGDGNDGNEVILNNQTGFIRTAGQLATAVMMQSIGGGGGNGGAGSANSYRYDGAATDPKVPREVFKLAATIGGDGGKGGKGGSVRLENNAIIETAGDMAAAVMAQSIGGGGGNGGLSHSDAVKVDRAVEVKVGGKGGDGGRGGSITIENKGSINTVGVGSVGVLMQSIGGGGGRGGVAGGAGSDTENALKKMNKDLVDLTAEVVKKTNEGKKEIEDIINDLVQVDEKEQEKQDDSSQGKKDDGKSKDTNYFTNVVLGGSGGKGGQGGSINLSNFHGASITTSGDLSAAVLAQSIGGGGGDAADSKLINSAAKAKHYDLVLGGSGGSGNKGGDITISNHSAIGVLGISSDAITAQSIGGGGGRAGSSSSQGNTEEDQYSLVIGGDGGSGGDAGSIKLFNQSQGVIAVANGGGHAILLQSIGGGGGQANLSTNQASEKDEDKEKNLVDGELAEGKKSIKLTFGGKGGAGGHGGDITLANDATIVSESVVKAAVLAQSIGGGGGAGGSAETENNTKASTNISLSLGGSGGKGSDGKKVSIINNGTIQTTQKQAAAIVVQSIGGGGGSAGLAQADGNVKQKTIQLSLGGSGGDGGKGGDISIHNSGGILAGGMAILAQSIGGGGGHAAGADSVINAATEKDEEENKAALKDQKDEKETPQTRSISLAIGGVGGNGGDAGKVSVNNTGRIVSDADLMAAIVAQSISGGGGAGGAAINDNQAEVDSSWNLALGGSAGKGKTGGAVDINNASQLVTTGLYSGGIVGQSIGGGGGIGGLVNQDVLKAKQKAWSLSVGSKDGDQGHGGSVTIKNTGVLNVQSGVAMLGQSIGGGGGVAGLAQHHLTEAEKASAISISEGKVDVIVGARKAKEGKGGTVSLNNSGFIQTTDSLSVGVVGQSVGGGGGHAFLQQAQNFNTSGNEYRVGSVNGKGSGGQVSYTQSSGNNSQVSTLGAGSVGVLLQSLGGGGGSLLVKQTDRNNRLGKVMVGGEGQESGHGGTVQFNNATTIQTQANNALGILAQSIGGGGGYVDFLSGQTQGLEGINAAVQLGGNNTSGNGGAVSVRNNSRISTQGKNSHAVVAQSIGGGGGYVVHDTAAKNVSVNVGGVSGVKDKDNKGNGGDVEVVNNGNISTTGNGSYGILAQSIGGGGGIAADTSVLSLQNAAKNIAKDSAVNNKVEGNGGKINISHVGTINVTGKNSHAIFAQSVANGGGLTQQGVGNHQGSDKKNKAGDININIGNAGSYSYLSALGENGIGIFAQLASTNSASGNDTGHIKLDLNRTSVNATDTGLYLLGGNDNNEVKLSNSHVEGGRFGVLQHGEAKKQQVNLRDGSWVHGNDTGIKVTAHNESKVSVEGSSKVQGGSVGVSLKANKTLVDVKSSTISAPKTAIELESKDEHKVVFDRSYATDSEVAMKFLGAGKGIIEVKDGVLGRAQSTLLQQVNSNKDVSINNKGHVAGSIFAGGKVSVKNDNANSIIEMGRDWNLNGGKLENKGKLYVNGKGVIGTTYLNGELQQNSSGVLHLDADFANDRYDRLILTNDKVGADFHETRIVIDAKTYKPGASATIVSSAKKEIRFNKKDKEKDGRYKFRVEAGENNLFTYDFKREYTHNLVVTPSANFTNSDWYKNKLNQDQRSVAAYLQNSWDVSAKKNQQTLEAESALLRSAAPMARSFAATATEESTDVTPALTAFDASSHDASMVAEVIEADTSVANSAAADSLGLLYGQMDNVVSAGGFAQLLSSLASDVQSSPAAAMPLHNRQFINKMFTCQSLDGTNMVTEDACVWADVRYNRTKYSGTFEDFGYDLKSNILQFGGEYEFRPSWWVGGSLGYESLEASSNQVAVKTNGDNVSGGVFLKHMNGPWQWALGYNLSRGSYDTTRGIYLPEERLIAKSDWNSWLHAVSMRGAYTHSWQNGYLRPSLDAILMYQRNPAYSERNAGAYNLDVAQEDRWTLMLSPQVELAHSFTKGAYTWMPYVSVGANWTSDDNWHSKMRLQGSSSNEWIHVNSDLPQVTADAKVGVDLMHRNGINVKLEYNGQWGQHYKSHTGRVRFAYQF